MKVENRHSISFAFGIEHQTVVAYLLSDSDLIIRAADADDGAPRYMRHRWGREQFASFPPDKFPDWHLGERVSFSDLGAAIQGFLFDKKAEGLSRVIPERFRPFDN
ncbi:MAG: hypothetical protein WDN28_23540 [Chthoniobacter sp.]